MKVQNERSTFRILVYIAISFFAGYYFCTNQEQWSYDIEEPQEAEYIGIEDGNFAFTVFRYGKVHVSFEAFKTDAEFAKIIDLILIHNSKKLSLTVSPLTPDTTEVYLAGSGNTLHLNPVFKKLFSIGQK